MAMRVVSPPRSATTWSDHSLSNKLRGVARAFMLPATLDVLCVLPTAIAQSLIGSLQVATTWLTHNGAVVVNELTTQVRAHDRRSELDAFEGRIALRGRRFR